MTDFSVIFTQCVEINISKNYFDVFREGAESNIQFSFVGEIVQNFKDYRIFVQALQSVGQIVGEVLRQLTEEKFIVKV